MSVEYRITDIKVHNRFAHAFRNLFRDYQQDNQTLPTGVLGLPLSNTNPLIDEPKFEITTGNPNEFLYVELTTREALGEPVMTITVQCTQTKSAAQVQFLQDNIDTFLPFDRNFAGVVQLVSADNAQAGHDHMMQLRIGSLEVIVEHKGLT